ncbi:MAG: preprotein translocase subunit SecE [Oscillospiraceae bacterium]|nr:preprotein translocase subunit SecE [Oscillospiraceae bacterium]
MSDNKITSGDKTESKKVKKVKVKKPNRFTKWFREMFAELKKVTWATKKQIINNTLIVLAVMVVAGILIWVLDFAGSNIFSMILRLFKRTPDVLPTPSATPTAAVESAANALFVTFGLR